MTFNLKKSQIYKAVLFYRIFPAGILKFYRVLIFILGLIPVIFLVINQAYSTQIEISLGWTLITLPFAFSILFFEWFGEYYLKYPPLPPGSNESDNIADLMEFEAAKIFDRAFEMSRSFNEKELSTRSLLLAMIEDNIMDKLFIRIMPSYRTIKRQLKESLAGAHPFSGKFSLFASWQISSEILKLSEEALALRNKHGAKRISVLDIMAVLYDYNEEFKQFILGQDLGRQDLEDLAEWYEHIWSFWREYKKFWNLNNLLKYPPIGREWIFGYARHLNAFAVNLTDKMEFSKPTVRLVSRQKEIEQIEQTLARSNEKNVLLVGEEGVGKDNVVNDLADLIVKGKALPQLNYKKIFDLNLSLIAGASKEISDVQNLLLATLNEAVKAGNIILVIKDFHNFIGGSADAKGGLGRIDVSEVLIPYLKSSNIQIIATTNPESFHRLIEGRSELTEVLDRINILEPDSQQTLKMVQEIVPFVESRQSVVITYGAIKQIIEGADKFIRTSPFPEKAFDLLSEVVSYAGAQKIRVITKNEVNEVISRKTGVPLGPVVGEEKERLVQLEKIMHQEIVGQNRAVEVVASTMRRLRAGLAKRGKPAGVFLFVGPTGVGKTLTAKILAKTYFGSADRMLRFDMSEYQELEALDRFLGNTRTNEPGQFVTQVRDNPFSLILLDELEKANKNILNIFLQVFDEGRLTDVFGRKVNFEENIIIATSNAGADMIRDLVNKGLDPSMEKEKVIDVMIQGRYFSPEFLNRFDEIVIFHPLSEEQAGQITTILLAALANRLKEQGYTYKPTKEVSDYVAKAGFDPQFGARPMERIIRDKIENVIAKKILDGSVVKGKEFSLAPEDLN